MQDIFKDWLNEDWAAAYGAYQPQSGAYNYLNYWKGQQGNVWDQYIKQLANMAVSGVSPNLAQTDYLSSYPFMSEYMKMSPQSRGERSPGFARWNIPF